MILRAAWTSESWPALKPHERKEPATTKNGGEKNGEMGKLGQDRLEVRWEAVMFLFNLVIWNVWLFLFGYIAIYIYSNITKKKQSNISDYKIEQKHNKQYNQKETVKHFRLQDWTKT